MGAAKIRRQLLGDEKYYQGQIKLKMSTLIFQCPDFFEKTLREKYDGTLSKVNAVIPVMLNNNQLLLTLDCEKEAITVGFGDSFERMSNKHISKMVMDRMMQSREQITLLVNEATNDEAVEMQKQVFSLLLILLHKKNLKKRPDALNLITDFIPV
jgi:hypothetical protein